MTAALTIARELLPDDDDVVDDLDMSPPPPPPTSCMDTPGIQLAVG